jgi:two-component system sensor histidine kinase BaeS
MAQIFDRLYRKESSRNKKFGGSGLGLAICKNIVAAHHGEITAQASTLGGIHLTVRMPKHV